MTWLPNLKQENFYIVDATDAPLKAVYFIVKRNTLLVRNYFESCQGIASDAILSPSLLTGFLAQINIKKNAKVIFIHRGVNAATFTNKVRLEKQHSNIPLTEADLGRIFGKATLQFFNQFGEEAKRRFTTDDLGLVLASSRILGLELDGKTKINPLGVEARRADVAIEQTFIRREVHEAINTVLPPTCGILHIEVGAVLYAIANLLGERAEKTLLVHTAYNSTHLYTASSESRMLNIREPLPIQYCGELLWGTRIFFEILRERLGVRAENADVFLEALNKNKASLRLISLVKKVAREAFTPFIAECHFRVPRAGRLLIFIQEPLASFLEQCPLSRSVLCIVPASLYNKDVVHHEIKFTKRLSTRALSPAFFGGFLAYLRRSGDNYFEAITPENMKWLIPHNSI